MHEVCTKEKEKSWLVKFDSQPPSQRKRKEEVEKGDDNIRAVQMIMAPAKGAGKEKGNRKRKGQLNQKYHGCKTPRSTELSSEERRQRGGIHT